MERTLHRRAMERRADARHAAFHDAGRMKTTAKFVKGIALGAVVSALTLVSTSAFAGSGIGGVFNLGKANSVDKTTTLQGSTNGQQLRVVNSSTGADAAGIGIKTDAMRPPLAVNSQVKVANLDADLLDGLDSNAFQQRVTGTCFGSGTAISSIGATGAVTCSRSAQFPIHEVLANGDFDNLDFEPGLRLVPQCGFGGQGPGLLFVNEGGTDASLNWMFSQGGANSTVNAQGQTVPVARVVGFNLGPSATRLEGQFIWADAHAVVTVRAHLVVDPVRCEFSGTVLVAATS